MRGHCIEVIDKAIQHNPLGQFKLANLEMIVEVIKDTMVRYDNRALWPAAHV